jgi:hypothetical protein
MNRELLRMFHIQVYAQCRFALLSYDEFLRRTQALKDAHAAAGTEWLNEGLTGQETNPQVIVAKLEPSLECWQFVQAMLSAVANISKALWGQSGTRAAERSDLRAALDVSESSPLRPTSMREPLRSLR